MGLTLITPPAAEPVSLSEAKAHLNVDHADHDALITLYLSAARSWIDGPHGWLGRAIMPQTWEQSLDDFPASEIFLPMAPVQSVTHVKYADADGIDTTIDAEDYYLDTRSGPGAWVFPGPAGWEYTTLDAVNAVRVTFVAGYANAAAVPAAIKAAILLMTGHLYRYREAVSQERPAELPMGVDALLSPYRLFFA